METSLFFLAFSLFWKLSSTSIQCFRCEVESYDPRVPLCKDFDGSHKFVKDCEFSTMCYKKSMSLQLVNTEQPVTIEERGCALQTLSGDQARINDQWRPVTTIYEVYEESCKQDRSDDDSVTKTTECYCRGNLCNSAINCATNYLALLTIFIQCLITLIR